MRRVVAVTAPAVSRRRAAAPRRRASRRHTLTSGAWTPLSG